MKLLKSSMTLWIITAFALSGSFHYSLQKDYLICSYFYIAAMISGGILFSRIIKEHDL